MLLLIDNFDSFTAILVHYFRVLGQSVRVVRNNAILVDDCVRLRPAHIVISPGPGAPKDAGISLALIARMQGLVPILGVCLGHQAIAESLGGAVVRGTRPMHGKVSSIHHSGQGLFTGLPTPFNATRYHSLVVDPAALPASLEITAWTEDGQIMALRHKHLPVHGVQFHPEACLTENGLALLRNFLSMKGDTVP